MFKINILFICIFYTCINQELIKLYLIEINKLNQKLIEIYIVMNII